MIEFIHKYPILIKILLTVTTVAFVLTGGFFMRDTVRYAARVDDEKITMEQLQKAVYNLEDFYKKIYQGNMPDDLLKKLDLNRMALNQLIDRKVILISAERMGLGVGDDEVAEAVRKVQAFQDKEGRFSKQVYTDVLRYQNMTPKDFELQLREDLLVEKFRKLIEDSVVVTDQDVMRYFMAQRAAQGKGFDEKEYEKNKENLRTAVKNDYRNKVMKSVIENLKSQLKDEDGIEIYPDALPSA